jgi:hypothetical protein
VSFTSWPLYPLLIYINISRYCKIALFRFLARHKEIVEKEAAENATAQTEGAECQQVQTERDRTRKKRDESEEQTVQRGRENDQGMD